MTDREQIAQVYHAYGRNIDLRTINAFAAEVFTPDAVVELSDRWEGIERIIAEFAAIRDTFASTAHVFGNLEADVEGDSARATMYVTFWHWVPGEEKRDPVIAVYVDKFVRTEPGWRIALHQLRPL